MKKAYNKLKEKYTIEELANSLMIPAEITPREEKGFAKLMQNISLRTSRLPLHPLRLITCFF